MSLQQSIVKGGVPAGEAYLTKNMDDLNLNEGRNAGSKFDAEQRQARTPGIKKKKRHCKQNVKRKGERNHTRQMSTGNGQVIVRTSTPAINIPTVATMLVKDDQNLPESPNQQQKNIESEGTVHDWVPVLPNYEVRAISCADKMMSSHVMGTNREKRGVFATENIQQGTRIISEPPLITLPAPGYQIDGLMVAFAELPKYEQDRVWGLDPSDLSVSPLLEALAEITEPILARTMQIVRKPKKDWTEEEEGDFKMSGAVLERALESLRIAARWHASCRSLINLPEDEQTTISSNLPCTGLFIETAHLRHSCVPNCYAHYNSISNRMTVHTTRTIANGEELTLSGISNIYYQNSEDRGKELNYKFGIKCSCEACNPYHPQFRVHEHARTRAKVRAVELNQFLTQVEMIASDNIVNDLCLPPDFIAQGRPTREELEEYAQSIVDLTKDLKVTGCTSLELVRWYNGLIDRIQPRLADEISMENRLVLWKVMLARATGCEHIAQRCLGEDTEEFETIRKRRERIESTIKKAELRMNYSIQ
ncbi:hypothetical protein BKA66DRAFT_24079 [Pyrenochaeta sp. MPI-SDFR-AT-0127]|nr:hypothetical protein BKA66DRAFT_24079 [Pyrenochaeta sp. MPI-SDFR-AT-0127]